MVRSDEPLVGSAGQELAYRLDVDTRRMILAPHRKGREAVAAVCAMHLNAEQYEAGKRYLSEGEGESKGASLELLLRNFQANDQVMAQINAVVDRLDNPSRRRPVGRYALAASVSMVFAAFVATCFFAPQNRAPSAVPVHARDFNARDLAHGKELRRVPFPGKALAVAAHPTQPGFVVADDQLAVSLVTPPFHQQLLVTTESPVYSVHVAPDGSEAAVCDWSGAVLVVPISSDTNADLSPVAHRPPDRVGRAYALGGGQVLCVDATTERSYVLGGSRSLPDDARNAMPAGGGGGLIAYETVNAGRRALHVVDADHAPLLHRRLGSEQRLAAFDFDADHATAVLQFGDGTLSLYRQRDGRMRLDREINPRVGPPAAPYVLLSPDGTEAWIGNAELTRWGLADFEPNAWVAMPGGQRLLATGVRVQLEPGERLMMAGETMGVFWE
ncbi:MAG: hypothetical protein AAGE65_02565 [Planctomycetota bacterium]